MSRMDGMPREAGADSGDVQDGRYAVVRKSQFVKTVHWTLLPAQ